MAVVMVAMLAFGGTYAYFTATAATSAGTAYTGYVKLTTQKSIETVVAKSKVLPGDALLDADVEYIVDTTDAKGNYVAVKVTVTATAKDDTDVTAALGLNSITLTGWTKGEGDIYYLATPVLPTANPVAIKATDFKLSAEIDDNWAEKADTSKLKLQDATITITIKAASVQASNVASVDAALTELTPLLNA